jgi:DNA-binding NarL/FixJ family response regulator
MLARVVHLLQDEFEVVGAVNDGQALLEAAAKLRPDVVILDISMPVMNGLEAAHRLKEAGCEAKVVFLTVHEDPDFVQESLVRGALGYVVKPRLTSDLVPAIKEALANRAFTSPLPQR